MTPPDQLEQILKKVANNYNGSVHISEVMNVKDAAASILQWVSDGIGEDEPEPPVGSVARCLARNNLRQEIRNRLGIV